MYPWPPRDQEKIILRSNPLRPPPPTHARQKTTVTSAAVTILVTKRTIKGATEISLPVLLFQHMWSGSREDEAPVRPSRRSEPDEPVDQRDTPSPMELAVSIPLKHRSRNWHPYRQVTVCIQGYLFCKRPE